MSRRCDGGGLGEFLSEVGRLAEDLADALIVAGVAALTGIGVAKAAPVVRRAAQATGGLLEPSKSGGKDKGRPGARKPATGQPKARSGRSTRPAPQPDSDEVIDLTPGPDGVYR